MWKAATKLGKRASDVMLYHKGNCGAYTGKLIMQNEHVSDATGASLEFGTDSTMEDQGIQDGSHVEVMIAENSWDLKVVGLAKDIVTVNTSTTDLPSMQTSCSKAANMRWCVVLQVEVTDDELVDSVYEKMEIEIGRTVRMLVRVGTDRYHVDTNQRREQPTMAMPRGEGDTATRNITIHQTALK